MENPWILWAKELQFLSQSALAYCRDVYDIERFERIREISAEMMARIGDTPVETVRGLFCNEVGYQTPKLDTRAAVLRDGKILLVQERNGRWALPGGWVDYDQSIRSNAEKEVFEEAGMRVRALRLIAALDHNRHNTPPSVYSICSIFVLCEYLSGDFTANNETIACGFFAPDALPSPLAENKTRASQIDMCFRAAADPQWQVLFD